MLNEHDIKDMEEYQQKAWTYAMPTAKNPSYLFGNLGGEVGEVLSLWSKTVRDGLDAEQFYPNLKKELGDTLWHISAIATYYGMSLADVAEANIEKLQSRKERNTLKGSGDDR